MNTIADHMTAVAIIVIFLIAVVVLLWVFLGLIRGIKKGQGPLGSVIQQNREVAKESVSVARERIQVERELLDAQRETNELLKQLIANKKG